MMSVQISVSSRAALYNAELNHSFFQLQMMMKMIMNKIVENGLIFLKGVHSGTRGEVKER